MVEFIIGIVVGVAVTLNKEKIVEGFQDAKDRIKAKINK